MNVRYLLHSAAGMCSLVFIPSLCSQHEIRIQSRGISKVHKCEQDLFQVRVCIHIWVRRDTHHERASIKESCPQGERAREGKRKKAKMGHSLVQWSPLGGGVVP